MYTPHHKPSPHRCCQDPLDCTRRSLHRHRCCRRPPSPLLSATTAIVAIMGLVVALCRLPPPSSSSLSSNAVTIPPTKESPQPCPRSPPPMRSSSSPLPSRPLPPLDRPWRHLGLACSVNALWYDAASADPARAPLVERRANCASAAVTAAAMPRSPLRRPELDPPSFIEPPPPVGRRRRQHVDVDACPWHLWHHKVWCV